MLQIHLPAPHERNATVVQVPAESFGRLLEQHEALGVRDDLGGVEGLANGLDELCLVARELGVGRSVQDLAGRRSLVKQRRKAASEHRLADERHRNAEVERLHGRPFACAFLQMRSKKCEKL